MLPKISMGFASFFSSLTSWASSLTKVTPSKSSTRTGVFPLVDDHVSVKKPKRSQSSRLWFPDHVPANHVDNSLLVSSRKKTWKQKTRGAAADHPIEKLDPTPEQETSESADEEVDSEGGSFRENHPIIKVYPRDVFYAMQREQKDLEPPACQPTSTKEYIYPSQDGPCEIALNEHYSKVENDLHSPCNPMINKYPEKKLYSELSFRVYVKDVFEPTRKNDKPYSDFSFHDDFQVTNNEIEDTVHSDSLDDDVQVTNDEIKDNVCYLTLDDHQATNEEIEDTIRSVCGPSSGPEVPAMQVFWCFLKDKDTHSQSSRWWPREVGRADSIRLKWFRKRKHEPEPKTGTQTEHEPKHEPEPKTGTQTSRCKKSNPGKLKKIWRSCRARCTL